MRGPRQKGIVSAAALDRFRVLPVPLEAEILQERLRSALGLPLFIGVARGTGDEESLTAGERATCDRLRSRARVESWLRGRAALKQILRSIDEAADSASISFPHHSISLSHSGEYGIAAGLRAGVTSGLGIDLEVGRQPPPGSERFFLEAGEKVWLQRLDSKDRPVELLRLWTTKEALFKANLRNKGSLLGHYVLEDPSASIGLARWREEEGTSYRYASVALQDGYLTVAMRPS